MPADRNALPAHEVLTARLERQRDRALQAQSISALATGFAGSIESAGEIDAEDAVMLRSLLEHLTELLESIKNAISPEDMLDPKPTQEEVANG
jgi:hypothetical protein